MSYLKLNLIMKLTVLNKIAVDLKIKNSFKNGYSIFLLFVGLICQSHLYGRCNNRAQKITYYLNIADFATSFVKIPTSNLSPQSTTIASSYLGGIAPIYNVNNTRAGNCSASFLSFKSKDGIFTNISNFLAADNGLIVTWFTPTKLANLKLDSVIHSMVTECIVTVTTKIGASLFYGQKFNLVVSSRGGKIYFQFTRI